MSDAGCFPPPLSEGLKTMLLKSSIFCLKETHFFIKYSTSQFPTENGMEFSLSLSLFCSFLHIHTQKGEADGSEIKSAASWV